jgi:RimJ/RimL family protein N-acetyltransferase
MSVFPLDRTHPPRRILYGGDGRHCVLRPWGFDDVQPLVAAKAASSKQLREFMVWAHEPVSPEIQYEGIRRFIGEYWAGREYVFGLFDADGGLLGCVGLHPRTALNPRALEVGYWCHSAHAGRGWTTLAVRVLAVVAFDWFDCDRLQVMHDESNLASQRVVEKIGFRFEGTLRNAVVEVSPEVRAGGYRGSALQRLYAITPDDLPQLAWVPAVRASTVVEDALGNERRKRAAAAAS